ncbi:hypothetical protein BJF90_26350 [Pseudonocardia sp. CNS-004]|nr:hypothetical protein BJF90_26350 [Pseudonocardia sp. CNS-004]
MCGWLIDSRERLLVRLEKAETDSRYPSRSQYILRESALLDSLELAFDEYVGQYIRNIPRLWRARQELDSGQEQAA